MSPMTAELVAVLEAERLRPTPPPAAAYPDGPTAAWMRDRLVAEVAETETE